MAKFVLSFGSQKSRLAAAVAAAPLLATDLALYTNDLDPESSNVLADFTEATFGGYARADLVFGAVVIDDNGIPVAPASGTFTCDGTAPSEICFGCYLLDSTGALVGAGRFPEPKSFAVLGDFEIVALLFGLVDATITLAEGP